MVSVVRVRAVVSVRMTMRRQRGVAVRWRNSVTVGRSDRVAVRRANSVHLVATRVMALMSTVAARKTEKRHGSHAGGSENHTEDV